MMIYITQFHTQWYRQQWQIKKNTRLFYLIVSQGIFQCHQLVPVGQHSQA